MLCVYHYNLGILLTSTVKNEYPSCDKLVHKTRQSNDLNKNVTFQSYRLVDSLLKAGRFSYELIQAKWFVSSTEPSLLHRNN